MHDTNMSFLFLGLGLGLITLFYVVYAFFCWSVYSAMHKVPMDKQMLPDWLAWLMIIPFAGFIFAWILLPFTVPKSLAAATTGNQAAQDKTNTLFGLGLAHMILTSVSIIPFVGFITGFASLIIWIIYWVKIVSFRKEFMLNPMTAVAN